MVKRYYNGVAASRTTICCSALALTMAAGVGSTGQTPTETLALFPLRTAWTLALNGSLAAPPVFNGSRAYFPIEGGLLAAYDLDNGEQHWMVSAQAQSKPAAGDGLLFVVERGALAALREADGAEAWRLPFAEPLAAPLVWSNGWLIASSMSGSVLAFRGVDGHLIWRRDIGVPVSAAPALAADRMYLPASDSRLVALQVETGEPLWERRLGGAPNELLALDDRLYVGSNDNFFYCLTTRDGQIAWRWRTGADVIGLPAFDENRVYFVSLDNVLRALDRRSGSQRWNRPLPFRPLAGALKVGEALIVSGVAPPLRAYRAPNGAPAGEAPIQGEFAAPPHVATGPRMPLLVVVTRDFAKGTTVTVFTREIDPPVVPIAPLPNPVSVTIPATL